MDQEELKAMFDEWALTYDREVGDPSDRFPFAGYDEVLLTIWQEAAAAPGSAVLDLGVGTGNLSRLFLELGCRVVGVDFSAVMLEKTREKFPQMELVQADLTLDEWPAALNGRFDHIVSNYTFHEFPFETKLGILSRLAENNLSAGSRIVIGDITFPSQTELERVREELGDEWEEEFYWTEAATRQALEPAGWRISYQQLSFCAGVYTLTTPA